MALERRARAAWLLAAPLIALALLLVVLPFAWRSGSALWQCSVEPGCADLLSPYYTDALMNTVALSAASVLLALPLAVLAGMALLKRPGLAAFTQWLANQGANFAGVPLALAMTLLFGVQGLVTQSLGWSPVSNQGWSGLLVAYLCFQWPLAVVLLLPAMSLLDANLPEAAATLGASPWRYWRLVGLPLLAPSLVEVGVLLFANAAAAYATPFALAGGSAQVLSVRLSSLVSGDLFADPRLPALLALELFLLLALAMAVGRGWRRRLEASC
jgi:putative spermidine/putrescine transport system permease protein